MKVIDAKNQILGRLATQVAKDLLRGEEVAIVNAEECVISGARTYVFEKYRHRVERKSIINPSRHGPFFPRRPEGIVRRAVRGMLPWEKANGKVAYKRLKVYIGVPKELADKKLETVSGASAEKLKVPKFMKLKELSSMLGAKF